MTSTTATATRLPRYTEPGEPGWLPNPPVAPAHVIRDDAEAIAVAEQLRPLFAAEAKERDRERRLPFREVDLYSQSGLWGMTIPKEYGGAAVSQVTLARVFATLAAGDPSLTQIAQNSFEIIDVIRQTGSEAQKRELFGAVLSGKRLGNAFSEFGSFRSLGQEILFDGRALRPSRAHRRTGRGGPCRRRRRGSRCGGAGGRQRLVGFRTAHHGERHCDP